MLNIDTAIEKIAVNFEYNAQTQQLIITLENGEKQYIDMSALITQYEFKNTDTIAFSVDNNGKVGASIKNGSITKAMLSSEVMAAITLSESNAAASAQAASKSAVNAELDAKLAQSYSVGKSGIRDGEEADNAKYYCNLAEKYKSSAVMSESNAEASEINAKASERNSLTSESNAKKSEAVAEAKANEALVSAEISANKADEAITSANAALVSQKNAENFEKMAQSYAVGNAGGVRENEDIDNSRYYAKEAQKYAKQAEDIAGGKFIPISEKGIAGGVAVLNDALAVEKAVADKNGNDISETYAEKTKVPTLIKVDGKTIIKDEDGTLHGSASVDVDTELSSSSTNPVQNKAVKKVLDGKVDNSATGVSEAINKLSEGTSTPADNDYYIAQYAGGGTTTKTYHRRPVSALWEYIKNKIGTVLGLTKNSYTGNAATATNASKVNGHSVNSDVPSNAKFTDTWRGIQNNLNSDSTSDSLSAAQGKALKNLVDGKFNTSGGTMTGDLRFSDIGDTATSKGICWAGSTDGASIFYRTDAKDAGRLVLNLTDDANTRIDFALNGTTKSYIDANGNFSGSAAKVNGHSVNSDVPSNAKFTDTNTWRPIVNNLVTTATGSSLDAAQGKVLNDKITAINNSLTKFTFPNITSGVKVRSYVDTIHKMMFVSFLYNAPSASSATSTLILLNTPTYKADEETFFSVTAWDRRNGTPCLSYGQVLNDGNITIYCSKDVTIAACANFFYHYQ